MEHPSEVQTVPKEVEVRGRHARVVVPVILLVPGRPLRVRGGREHALALDVVPHRPSLSRKQSKLHLVRVGRGAARGHRVAVQVGVGAVEVCRGRPRRRPTLDRRVGVEEVDAEIGVREA